MVKIISQRSAALLLVIVIVIVSIEANPKSRPYVAYRGNPFDQEIVTKRILEDGVEVRGGDGGDRVLKNPINRESIATKEDPRCPLSFRLGTTHSAHLGSSHHSNAGMHTPPVIHPLHPDFDAGSGRQILLTTDYEVLEMFTPSNTVGSSSSSSEQLKDDEQFPLLFESSSFYHSSPIVHDIQGDGVMDAILGDYDGHLHFVGLDFESQSSPGQLNRDRRKRYYHRISIPRLFVRKSWYEVAINRTKERESMELNHTKWEEFEPYHTYFAGISDESWRGEHDESKIRGFSGDVLNLDAEASRKLAERKKMEMNADGADSEAHRRLKEVVDESGNEQDIVRDSNIEKQGSDNEATIAEEAVGADAIHDLDEHTHEAVEDALPKLDEEEEQLLFGGDDAMGAPPDGTDDHFPSGGDAQDGSYDDYYATYRYGAYDDYYGHEKEATDGYESYQQYQEIQNKYYHDSNYLKLPPHLLSTCTLAEFPRAYTHASARPIDRIDEILLCAVSFYFDEDECKDPSKGHGKSFGKHANEDGGDETEEQRGRYVANAVMGYNMRYKYWTVQEVLDLSTDWSAPLGDIVQGGTAPTTSNAYSGMGAFALASPITANLDGGDNQCIIVGTSLGIVYAFQFRFHDSIPGWPVQMRHPVEQRVLVEDIVGNTNLEVFVVDVGGDVVCLDASGNILWARNLLREDETDLNRDEVYAIRGTSPMSLGDVEGTGELAIVLLAKVIKTDRQHIDQPEHHELFEYRLYAINAITSDDLPHFPMSLGRVSSAHSSHSMPQPLLIDLHENQRHWLDTHESKETIKAINRDAAGPFVGSSPRSHGGNGRGLHIVQPLGQNLYIIEGATSCSETIDVGESIPSMVMADDVHGTGGLDLVLTSSKGEILTLESAVVPYHPLNVWSAGVSRSPGSTSQTHGFSAKQGIFVHHISRQFRDILGIWLPVTFEIFDRRPNIDKEPDRQLYFVDIRAGLSAERTIMSQSYNATGVYTEKIQIPFGPGYYSISVKLKTTHGLVYEDTFHVGFNVNYTGGLWMIVCIPLVIATALVLMKTRKPNWEEDEDYGSRGTGILGRTPPP